MLWHPVLVYRSLFDIFLGQKILHILHKQLLWDYTARFFNMYGWIRKTCFKVLVWHVWQCTLAILVSNSTTAAGGILWHVVATKYLCSGSRQTDSNRCSFRFGGLPDLVASFADPLKLYLFTRWRESHHFINIFYSWVRWAFAKTSTTCGPWPHGLRIATI